MNAIQPSRTTPQPPNARRRMVSRTQRRQRHSSYQVVALETTVKLAVNIVLCTAAIAGLAQLLPYHLSQQAKLRDVRIEVKRTEKRVNQLSNDFSEAFDPAQARTLMQKQIPLHDPTQRQIIFWEKSDRDE